MRRPSSRALPQGWWQPVLWTVVAVASLNLLVGYLIAQALWPTRVPALAQEWGLALGLVAVAFLGLAVSGWAQYLRGRR